MVYDVRAPIARVLAIGAVALGITACAPEQGGDYGVYAGPAIAETNPRSDAAVIIRDDEPGDAGRDAATSGGRTSDAGIDAGRRADCGTRRR